jgi:hypothetical protein
MEGMFQLLLKVLSIKLTRSSEAASVNIEAVSILSYICEPPLTPISSSKSTETITKGRNHGRSTDASTTGTLISCPSSLCPAES